MSGDAGSKFLGAMMIAVGGLIAGLSGLCSFGFVAMTLGTALKGPAVISNLLLGAVMVGVFGGVPFVVGAALVFAGRSMLRSPPRPPSA